MSVFAWKRTFDVENTYQAIGIIKKTEILGKYEVNSNSKFRKSISVMKYSNNILIPGVSKVKSHFSTYFED